MYNSTLSQYIHAVPNINFIHEDEECVVFEEELSPQAPTHYTVCPKRKIIPRITEATGADQKLLGHLMLVAHSIAKQYKLDSMGYHVLVDEDFHTFQFKALHIFGRSLTHMLWPAYSSRL